MRRAVRRGNICVNGLKPSVLICQLFFDLTWAAEDVSHVLAQHKIKMPSFYW